MVSRIEAALSAVNKVTARKCGNTVTLNATVDLRADLGLDSMDIAEVIIHMEGILGRELDAMSVFPLRTVHDLSTLTERS